MTLSELVVLEAREADCAEGERRGAGRCGAGLRGLEAEALAWEEFLAPGEISGEEVDRMFAAARRGRA